MEETMWNKLYFQSPANIWGLNHHLQGAGAYSVGRNTSRTASWYCYCYY